MHLIGAASSPAYANYTLRCTADDNEDEYGIRAADTLRRNFYVDDVLKSVGIEYEPIKLKRMSLLTQFFKNTERRTERTSNWAETSDSSKERWCIE